MSESRGSSEATTNFIVSPRTVAVISSLISVSSLTALSIVATVQGADALSTVALGLGVLAFVAQLLLALGQSIVSNAQYEQTSSVNTKVQEALAEIRLSTSEALARRDAQFEQLLQTVVPAALAKSLVDRPDVTSEVDIDLLSAEVVRASISQLDDSTGSSDLAHVVTSAGADGNDIDSVLSRRPASAKFLRAHTASDQLTAWRALDAYGIARLRLLSDPELLELLRGLIQDSASH